MTQGHLAGSALDLVQGPARDDAVRESGLFASMVPREYGGYEADLDTFLFDREARYAEYGRLLLSQPIRNALV